MVRGFLFALLLIGCDDPEPAVASWQLLDDAEPAALLAVWGTDETDVWVSGGRTELAGGPTVLHYEDGLWNRVETGQPGIDLWWVFGVPGSDTVYFGGTNGTILRYREASFEKMTTPRTGTIFGIWGSSDNDLWAVGDGGNTGIVWRYDGTSWTEVALPANTPGRVFKVHGTGANDVWISCTDGLTLHWQGSTLERVVTGVPSPLFSIVTTPGRTIAVGGVAGVGEILENTGAGWTVVPLTTPVAWRGATSLGDTVYVVGEQGVVAHGEAGLWSTISQPVTQGDFHAAWIDPTGALWGVGGNFNQSPLTSNGFMTYFGTARPGQIP